MGLGLLSHTQVLGCVIMLVQMRLHNAHSSIYFPGTFDHSNIIQCLGRHTKIICLSVQNNTNESAAVTDVTSNLQSPLRSFFYYL